MRLSGMGRDENVDAWKGQIKRLVLNLPEGHGHSLRESAKVCG
ncbi:MAG: hypothetical protein SWH78_16245 [Thermodesulfobacteriota bacterium]|nr:hypothetical protein [Thermodesulfobacteriota bacterium]